MSQQGIYIYGIINEPERQQFDIDGVDESDVTTINFRDLAAVVSYASLRRYDRFDDQLTASALRTHQLVLESVMRDYTVIPMGFGIITGSEDEVTELLETAYSDFKDVLRTIDNRIELNLQVTCDEAKTFSRLVSENNLVKDLGRQLVIASADGAGQIRVELGKLIASALYRLKSGCREDVLGTLNRVAVDSCPGRLTDADMIVNESFLVERSREAEFDREVNRLAEVYQDRFGFKYIGPMPPYSFIHLTTTVLSTETIDRARNLLGVGKKVTITEIKSAYRQLARRYHPDSKHSTPGSADKFSEITEAFDILLKSIQSLKPAKDDTYMLRSKSLEGSILVTRRS